MTQTVYLLAAALVCASVVGEASADTRYGLDQRPANSACFAPELPLRNIRVKAIKAFGSLTFAQPISIQQAPNDASRWFVAERAGRIRTFDGTFASSAVALDISSHMAFTSLTDLSHSQQAGVTAIALHPNFQQNGFLYIAYNRKPSAAAPVISTLSRFTTSDGVSFDPASEKILLTLEQSTSWHHIGQILFGPDGYLYVGLGDGSKVPPDPRRLRAQDSFSLWGKILRIDPDGGDPYGIPPSNPYADGLAGAPEVFAMGFRNPWRFTFDRQTGEMWAGDVGQATYEEVDRIVKGGNYGWPIFEGPRCTQATCDGTGFIAPVHSFTHADGPAVIGGYVYRGPAIAALQGIYVFGSSGITTVWGLMPEQNGTRLDLASVPNTWTPMGFYEDAAGELYVLNGLSTGSIYMLAPNDPNAPGPTTNVAPLLSQTGCVDPANPTGLAQGVIPYDINMPLWSDGAGKVRGVALPDGQSIDVRADGTFDFPEGTVLVKTFTFDGRPVETRLFMRHPGGAWLGYSYEWRADLSDADLLPGGGKLKTINLANGGRVRWTYPSRNGCLTCHNAAAGSTLGVDTAQLNRDLVYASTGRTSNQLATWQIIGMFSAALPPFAELPAMAGRTHAWASPVRRARDYLHANCAFCHRPAGVAQANLDFRASTPIADVHACDEPPLTSDLGVTGASLLTPGDPAHSLISLRMRRRDGAAMPPLATKKVDGLMAGVVDGWIRRGDVCAAVADSDGDGVPDNADNCIQNPNPDQADDNKDGYGNRCDGDFNGDLATNDTDRAGLRFKASRGWKRNDPGYTPQHDLDHDMVIDARDLAIFDGQLVGRPPGPSALKP